MNTISRSERRMHAPSGASRGMTLAEVLVTLAVFIVVMVAIFAFETSVDTNQRTASGSFQTVQDSQIILKTILTELRSAAPGANGAYTIASAAPTSISFFSDPDGDGKTEEIGYALIGNTLFRTVIQPSGNPVSYPAASQSTSTLVSDVRNSTSTPVFQYFDQEYTGTSSPLAYPIDISAIRLVQVNLTLDADPSASPATRTYTMQVSLRNLKTNL